MNKRTQKRRRSLQFEILSPQRVSLSLSKVGVIIEVEKNLITCQCLCLMPETSSKGVTLLNSAQSNSVQNDTEALLQAYVKHC